MYINTVKRYWKVRANLLILLIVAYVFFIFLCIIIMSNPTTKNNSNEWTWLWLPKRNKAKEKKTEFVAYYCLVNNEWIEHYKKRMAQKMNFEKITEEFVKYENSKNVINKQYVIEMADKPTRTNDLKECMNELD